MKITQNTLKKAWIILMILTIAASVGFAFITALGIRKAQTELTSARDSIQTFKEIVGARSQIIARQEQEIVTLKNFKAQDEALIKELKADGIKKVNTIIKLETENKRLKLEASFKPDSTVDTLVVTEGPAPGTYLRVPQPFSYGDRWTFVAGNVKSTGVTIDSLITFNEPQIVLGWSKGFLKKSKPIVDYSDKCPYVRVTSMENRIIVRPKPFFQNPWILRLEGALGLYGAQRLVQAVNQK